MKKNWQKTLAKILVLTLIIVMLLGVVLAIFMRG